MDRRTFIQTGALAGAGVLAATNGLAFSAEGDPERWNANENQYLLPKLPYSYFALEPVIDATTMEFHHLKHHKAYVDKLNAAIVDNDLEIKAQTIIQLTDFDKANGGIIVSNSDTMLTHLFSNIETLSPKLKTAIRNHGGGHWNHSFFWEILTPTKNMARPANLENALKQNFGSFEAFQTQFSDSAKSVFGSGWVWLVKQTDGKLAITTSANQENPLMSTAQVKGKPILALDVWEHAYYLKYQNRRADYINGFWEIVNWNKAASAL